MSTPTPCCVRQQRNSSGYIGSSGVISGPDTLLSGPQHIFFDTGRD